MGRREAVADAQTATALSRAATAGTDSETAAPVGIVSQNIDEANKRNSNKHIWQDNTQSAAAPAAQVPTVTEATSAPAAPVTVTGTSSAIVATGKTPLGVPPSPPVYVSPRKNIKRPKKRTSQQALEGDDGTSDSINALSAGSRGGCRRAQ